MYHNREREAELRRRRRVNENLRRLASGEVAREKAREKGLKAQKKEIIKENKRRITQIKRRLVACREELRGLQEYMDEQLLDENPLGYAEGMTAEQRNGLLEETDAALEGCIQEIIDLQEELNDLEVYNASSY